jgi:hypothetical protein
MDIVVQKKVTENGSDCLVHGEVSEMAEQFSVPQCCSDGLVLDLVVLFRAVVAESAPVKHQLLILNRSRERLPKSASGRSCGRGTAGPPSAASVIEPITRGTRMSLPSSFVSR